MDGEHEDVRYALVAFPLKVVFREPHGVESADVEGPGDCLGLVEDACQPLVGEPAVVDGKAVEADVVQVDVSGIQAPELGYHLRTSVETAL